MVFNLLIGGYLNFFRQGDLACLLYLLVILTCLIGCNDHLTALFTLA